MEKGNGILRLGLFAILIWVYGIVAWIANLVILLNCDFEGPWKQEIIHVIGLMGPTAMITVWF